MYTPGITLGMWWISTYHYSLIPSIKQCHRLQQDLWHPILSAERWPKTSIACMLHVSYQGFRIATSSSRDVAQSEAKVYKLWQGWEQSRPSWQSMKLRRKPGVRIGTVHQAQTLRSCPRIVPTDEHALKIIVPTRRTQGKHSILCAMHLKYKPLWGSLAVHSPAFTSTPHLGSPLSSTLKINTFDHYPMIKKYTNLNFLIHNG